MPERVLVTGAGGFVGGRLCQRICLGESYDVRPLVHRFSGAGAMRLARLPVDIVQGSVTDRDRMAAVIEGCDAVVHCAVGTEATNVAGTQTMLDVALAEGVDRFVHMSSAVVHGHDLEGVITEDDPFQPETEYAEAKATAERELTMMTAGTTLAPTVIRPYIVYGPHSEFAIEPLSHIAQGAVLADGGTGPMKQVYVDNVIDAILLALEDPAARGERYLICDDEQISWQQYYYSLADMLAEHPPIKSATRGQIRLQHGKQYASDSVVPPFAAIGDIATSPDVQQSVAKEIKRMPWAMGAFARLPEGAKEHIQASIYGKSEHVLPTNDEQARQNGGAAYDPPSVRWMKLHSAQVTVSTEKIKAELGWEPAVPFEEAMELIEAWARYEELV